MGVDEQRMTIGIQILGKACEVDLPGRREGSVWMAAWDRAPVVLHDTWTLLMSSNAPAARYAGQAP